MLPTKNERSWEKTKINCKLNGRAILGACAILELFYEKNHCDLAHRTVVYPCKINMFPSFSILKYFKMSKSQVIIRNILKRMSFDSY